MSVKQSLLINFFLVLLVATNIFAHENSWAFKNNNTTFVVMTLLGSMVAGQSQLASELRAKYAQDEENGNSKLSPQEVDDLIKKIDDIANLAAIFLVILLVPSALYILQDIYHYWSPTQEQIAENLEAHDRLNFLQSRASFRKCLFGSKQDSERGFLDSPLACEQLARSFVRCGGKDEILHMIQDFESLKK